MATKKISTAERAAAVKATIEATAPPQKAAAPALKAVAAPTQKAAPKKAPPKKVELSQAAALAIKVISKFTKGSQSPLKANNAPLPCVSSGSLGIDNMIGGTPAPDGSGPICMGYPRGHITEVYGPEASGKTTLALEAIASVQKSGGTAMFLDFEHALHHGYAQSLGVKFDPSLIVYQPENMEQGLEMLRVGVMAGMDLIVVDSVAAMVPKVDMEKGFEDSDQIGSRARKLASLLPKIVRTLKMPSKHNPLQAAVIFINQTRAAITAKGGEENTSGGKALKFFAYLRLRTVRIRSEYIERKDALTKKVIKSPYGNHTIVKVIKSKVDAKEGRICNIFIRFGQGIDDYYSMIEAGVAHRVVQKNGAFYEIDGHRFQGREKFRQFLIDNASTYKTLRDRVLEAIRTQDDITPAAAEDDEADELLSVITSKDDEDGEFGDVGAEEEVSLENEDINLDEV